MSKIICIVGGSGVGKDSVKNSLPLPHIISFRTRPIRKGEIDGVDGYFVNLDQYNLAKRQEDIVAENYYNGAHYWTVKEQFTEYLDRNIPVLYVVDGSGVLKLQQHFSKEKVVSIWLDASLATLVSRMQNRGDSYENIVSRIEYYVDIASRDKDICDYMIDANGSLESIRNEVAYIILNEVFNKNMLLSKQAY